MSAPTQPTSSTSVAIRAFTQPRSSQNAHPAEMAGTTLHTASRVLSGWKHAGILGKGGRQRIEVRRPRALERLTKG